MNPPNTRRGVVFVTYGRGAALCIPVVDVGRGRWARRGVVVPAGSQVWRSARAALLEGAEPLAVTR